MRHLTLATLVLAACALGLPARGSEMINLPVMEPPKPDSREGEFVFKLRTLRGKVELVPLIMVQNDVADPGQFTVK